MKPKNGNKIILKQWVQVFLLIIVLIIMAGSIWAIVKSVSGEETAKEEKTTVGNPINTSDVLEQLRQMRTKIEKELQEKKITPKTLQEPEVTYQLEKNEQKPELNSEEEVEDIQEIEEPQETQPVIEAEEIEEVQEVEEDMPEKPSHELQLAEEIIDCVGDPEVKREFEEIKQKMEELDDNTQVVSSDFDEMYTKLFGTQPIKEETEQEKEENTNAVDLIKDNVSIFEETEPFEKPDYKFVGIVFNTYIILEIDKEMYILDQHAAHERIMYERVKKNYYSDRNKDSQMLLLPDIITLTHKEMEIAKENITMFEQAGFSLEEFGENTIKLSGAPTVCIDLDTKELFLETLDEINTVARTAKQEKEEKFIATVACKAAVKANMALDQKEVEALMDKLLQLPNPFTCPHGRPTVIKMTKYDIERKFARK